MDFVNQEGADFPRSRWAFSADAAATIIGSIFSLSPVTSYIESGAGVEAGSKTGLTAILVGFCFFLSIFFAPIIASIPPWATGGTLIIVGSLMARSLTKVKWRDPAHAATAFMTVLLMPLTYSIAYGLLGGLMTWIILQLVFFPLKLVGIERPSFDDEVEAAAATAGAEDHGHSSSETEGEDTYCSPATLESPKETVVAEDVVKKREIDV